MGATEHFFSGQAMVPCFVLSNGLFGIQFQQRACACVRVCMGVSMGVCIPACVLVF